MIDLHDRFDDWLVAGAEDELPRDLAVHASSCDACLRSIAAIDSLQAIDIGASLLPPLAMRARAGRAGIARTLRYAVGSVAVVLLGASVAIGASGLLSRAPLVSDQAARSPAEGVLAGVPSPSAAPQPVSQQPTPSASDGVKPGKSASERPAVAEPTGMPFQVLPHGTPFPQPLVTPEPTAAPTATAVPTATPIVTPSPASPSASPSIVVPTATPNPTATPLPQCSNGVDDDTDLLVDFPLDPGCTSPDDPTEGDTAP